MSDERNYFEAEGAIVNRLKSFTGIEKVYTPFSLADMVESSQASPALHVIYAGDVVAGSSVGGGTKRTIDQRWLVVLAVRNPKAQLNDTIAIRADSGVIIPKILDALQGWKPIEWMLPLGRVSGPAAGYS